MTKPWHGVPAHLEEDPLRRRSLSDINEFLYELANGMGRVTKGEVPNGSGGKIGDAALSDIYLVLLGRPGNQTGHGGTSPSGSLSFSSTTSATKGFIYLGADAAYDETNARLGIGELAPEAKLHITVPSLAQFVYPIQDISVVNLGGQDGGLVNLYSYMDEITPSDADYTKQLIATMAGFNMKVGPISDPGTLAGFKVSIRCKNTSTHSNDLYVFAAIDDGSTTLWNAGYAGRQQVSGTWTTYEFTATLSQAPADWSNVRISISPGLDSLPDDGEFWYSWLRLEVPGDPGGNEVLQRWENPASSNDLSYNNDGNGALTLEFSGTPKLRIATSGLEFDIGTPAAGNIWSATDTEGTGAWVTLGSLLDDDLEQIGALTRNRGDLIVGGASAWVDLAIGIAGTFLASDGTDPGWGNTLTLGTDRTALSLVTTSTTAGLDLFEITNSGQDIFAVTLGASTNYAALVRVGRSDTGVYWLARGGATPQFEITSGGTASVGTPHVALVLNNVAAASAWTDSKETIEFRIGESISSRKDVALIGRSGSAFDRLGISSTYTVFTSATTATLPIPVSTERVRIVGKLLTDTAPQIDIASAATGYIWTATDNDGNGVWAAAAGGTHVMLDSTIHTDTLTGTVVAGDVIYGNATPKWARLPKATDGDVLTLVAGLPGWAAPAAGAVDVLRTWTTAQSFPDDLLLIIGSATPTKIARFEVDGLAVGTNIFTLPTTAADTIAVLNVAQTFTTKTIALGSNTVSGTKAEFNTAVTDDNFAFLGQANIFTTAQKIDLSSNVIGLVIEASAAQVVNLLEINTDGGTGGDLAYIDSGGGLGAQTFNFPGPGGTLGTLVPAGVTTNPTWTLPDFSGQVVLSTHTINLSNKTLLVGGNTFRSSTSSSGVAFVDNVTQTKLLRMVLSGAVGSNTFTIANTAARDYKFPDYGGFVAVPVNEGTAAQVLTSAGAGVQPTWSAPAGGPAADPSYTPGSFTVATGTAKIMSQELQLTGTQDAILVGTATLRIT